MRIRFWDRLLAAFTGLLVLLAGLGLLVYGIGVFPIKLDLSVLEGPFALWQRVVMVAVALVLTVLGVHEIGLLFHRKGDKRFVIQHTEYGDMSISMNAMETMVKRCVDSHQELKANSTRISHGRQGVLVDLKITLKNGVNIPDTVSGLQKQIKKYIAACSGVDVEQVRVTVETDNQTPKLPAGQEPVVQPAPVFPEEEPRHTPAQPAEEAKPVETAPVEDAAEQVETEAAGQAADQPENSPAEDADWQEGEAEQE